MNAQRFDSAYTLLGVLLVFLVVSLLAYRTMEFLQEKNDREHGFSEKDALLEFPQFRLVDTSGGLVRTILSNDPGSRPVAYVVLAGSFITKGKAEEHLQEIRRKGIKGADLVHFEGEHEIYAIAVGKHATLELAERQLHELKREYRLDAYVHKVR